MDTIRRIAFWFVALLLLAPAAPVLAAEIQTDEDGIPSTAVARLIIGKGTAWVRSGGSADWEESASNFPLVDKSRVSIPDGSEAEIRFRGSQSLLLRGGSEVDIRQLGEKEVSYRLRSGEAVLSLPKEDFAPVRVAVPGNREVRVDTPGRYSLSTDGGTTRFLVRAGEGTVTGEEGSPNIVRAGEEASIGDKIRISRVETASPEPDPEATLTGPEADAGVPPAVAGELRQYGEWVMTREYGYVWRPYVEDGWEPYYYGRWTWVSPYGWNWVGYEPWGWWPYHTGWWWPSPAYGWVWCPFGSFVSVNFFFGHSVFHGHHARFFPANVRFVGRDRFVRWVPSRPGERRSNPRTFARGDARLARWDRPVERGSVRVLRDGGRPVAWEGRGGSPRIAAGGRGTGTVGSGRSFVRPSGTRGPGSAALSPVSPGGNNRITRPRSGGYGAGVPSIQRGRSSRHDSGSGGRITGNPGTSGIHRGPGRSSSVGAPPSRSYGGSGGGSYRGSSGGGYRGFGGGSRGSGRIR